MRRVGAWGMAAALVVGLGAAVAAGEPDSDAKRPPAKGLLSGWFGDKPKPKAAAEKKKPSADDDRAASARASEAAVQEQQRQMNALLRRMQVCDRLRLIAEQTGNDQLMRQADELEARAQEVYRQQTAHLPVPAPAPEADPTTPVHKPADAPPVPGADFTRHEHEVGGDSMGGRDKP